MKDAGLIKVCTLENIAEAGQMPKEVLIVHSLQSFEERTVGYNRQYAAKGVSEQVDMLVRIWRDNTIRIGMYAVLTDYEGQEDENGDQYRITNVQQVYDANGLKNTDLTLSRLEEFYELAEQA